MKGKQEAVTPNKFRTVLRNLCITSACIIALLRVCFPARTDEFTNSVFDFLRGESNFMAVRETVQAWLWSGEEALPAFRQMISSALGGDEIISSAGNECNEFE